MAIYFASDFHLGIDADLTSRQRERAIISWINHVISDMTELYILGDIFDFWYEYKYVIPKGHVRLLAKIADLVDGGIPVHIFTGNHDMWMFGYLEEELNITLHRNPLDIILHDKKIKIGHGDGLGPGDKGYKIMKKIFASTFNQWLFGKLHPDLALHLMKYSSRKSREKDIRTIDSLDSDKEWLIQYAELKLKKEHYDYFIFGHRHLPIDYTLSNKVSRYINTGDWLEHYTYAKMENGHISLEKYEVNI